MSKLRLQNLTAPPRAVAFDKLSGTRKRMAFGRVVADADRQTQMEGTYSDGARRFQRVVHSRTEIISEVALMRHNLGSARANARTRSAPTHGPALRHPGARGIRPALRKTPYAYRRNFKHTALRIDQARHNPTERVAQGWRCAGGVQERVELMNIKQRIEELPNHSAMEWQPIESAPFDRDLEVAVLDAGEIHRLVFPCRRTLRGWVTSSTAAPANIHPTHWRGWDASSSDFLALEPGSAQRGGL